MENTKEENFQSCCSACFRDNGHDLTKRVILKAKRRLKTTNDKTNGSVLAKRQKIKNGCYFENRYVAMKDCPVCLIKSESNNTTKKIMKILDLFMEDEFTLNDISDVLLVLNGIDG